MNRVALAFALILSLTSNVRAQWVLNGVTPCPTSLSQLAPVIVSDGVGGVLVAWQDARNGTQDIYVCRINHPGNMVWIGACGAVNTAAGDQTAPVMVSDGAGGAIIAWEDTRNGGIDIYAQRIDALGKALWNGNGVAVCTGAGAHAHPTITTDGAQGAIIVTSNAVNFIGGRTFVVSPVIGTGFSYSLPGPIPPGVSITAIATDVNGNTSEISPPIVYYNTGGGSNSTADLVDANGAPYGTATYSNVTGPGNTYTTNPYTPPVPVSGCAIGNPNDPQIYYNITTDASYTGGVDVCLNYDENNIPGPEANLVLLHYDGSMWVNVTTSRDLVNNMICGHVTSLSPFVIGASTTTAVGDTPLPDSFALHANVPNPFNPITTIAYDIPAGGADVNISIYDVAGRLVRELVHEHRAAGVWTAQWHGDDDRGQRVASGVYFYRMRAGEFVETKKMVLLK